MTEKEIKLAVGGLLHDIGKLIYRQGECQKAYGDSGYDFLKQKAGLDGNAYRELLEIVRYCHAGAPYGAPARPDALAFVVYAADQIASAADRRMDSQKDAGSEIHMPLQSIFNRLNGNQGECCYAPGTLYTAEHVQYPTSAREELSPAFYQGLLDDIRESLAGLQWTVEYVNYLLSVLEASLSYVPASVAKDGNSDISLYDHVKLTAAIASCIYQYLQECKEQDYKSRLSERVQDFYKEEAFMLYAMDVSGIQDFIYTVASKNALKTLRARSFYLEIMMEHIIDGFLEKLHLSRANLIYAGGGHCYILMPNTAGAVQAAESYMDGINGWLRETFQIALYVASGYVPCSANTMQNKPQGSYARLFQQVGAKVSERKSRRYTPADLKMLNAGTQGDHSRECSVCKGIGKVNDEGVCPVCQAMEKFSRNILYDDFFTITKNGANVALPFPGGCYLTADSLESLKEKRMRTDGFVRAYSKNRMSTGTYAATKLWVGDYTTGKTFEEYAAQAEGIGRIGILRADVDNLGQAFVAGFDQLENQNRYVTLSRTAALSRQLSLFFKLYINKILAEPEYCVNGTPLHPRNASICYSGGDDLFLVGAWNEVIELAVDIRRDFKKYTQNTLTLSAGIGIYPHSYPIRAAAAETGDLEECSKLLPGKNAVTICRDGQAHTVVDAYGKEIAVSDGTYCWDDFEQAVLGEKYRVIYDFFETTQERGKNFLYRLLQLIRCRAEKINFARYVYLLSRLEPEQGAPPEQEEAYREFSSKMYEWVKSEKDCRQLKTAINLYAYMTREKEETGDGGE